MMISIIIIMCACESVQQHALKFQHVFTVFIILCVNTENLKPFAPNNCSDRDCTIFFLRIVSYLYLYFNDYEGRGNIIIIIICNVNTVFYLLSYSFCLETQSTHFYVKLNKKPPVLALINTSHCHEGLSVS